MTRPPKLPREERHRITRDGCDCPPPEGLLRGIEQFNRGEYWECHETLEELWISERRDVRYLYQGILLVAVGLLHLERGNHHGAVVKLESGRELLRRFLPECMGVDVGGLEAEAWLLEQVLLSGPHHLETARQLRKPLCRLTEESA